MNEISLFQIIIEYDIIEDFPSSVPSTVLDFIDGEPLTEKTEEYSPFKKKGIYTKPN